MTDVPLSAARALRGGLRAYPRDFYLLLVATFLLFANLHLLVPVLPLYVGVLGQASDVGLVIGAFSITAIASRPVTGRWVDSWGRRPVLLMGAVVFGLGTLLFIPAGSVPVLVAIRMLLGFGITFFTTSYVAMAADLAPPGRRGEALGFAGLSFPVSLIFVPSLGVEILRVFGFDAVFLIASLSAGAGLLVILLMGEPPHNPGDRDGGRGFRQVIRLRGVWVPAMMRFALGPSFGAVLAFLPIFALERGISNPGLFFTAYGVALLLVPLPAGRVSDRVGRVAVVGSGTAVAAVALGLLRGLDTSELMVLVGILYGFGFGGAGVALDAAVADAVPDRERGTAFGVVFAAFDLGIGLGSYLTGMVAVIIGYADVYFLTAILAAVAGVTFLGLMRGYWEPEPRLTDSAGS